MELVSDNGTEVLRKEFFNYLADLEIMRSMRYQNFATVIIAEPDQGFVDGSDLRTFAHILKDEFRGTDVIGRLDHNQFAILLPHADQKGSLTAGERVRKRIENYVFPEKQKKTVSLGAASFPSDVTSSNNLIALAEEMLKMAKEKGGNNVCFPSTC